MLMPSTECVQRSHHLEELEPSKYITSPRRRDNRLVDLYNLGVDEIWKFKRLSHAFSGRPKV